MSKRIKHTIDESIGREEVSMDDFKVAMQMMLQPEASKLKSENREPTKVEKELCYKLIRNK